MSQGRPSRSKYDTKGNLIVDERPPYTPGPTPVSIPALAPLITFIIVMLMYLFSSPG